MPEHAAVGRTARAVKQIRQQLKEKQTDGAEEK